MKNILKIFVSLTLCCAIVLGMTGCSAHNEMTEENVTKTVDIVEQALKDFDKKKLDQYVSSKTLSTIMKFADGHDQFAELGKAIFQNLDITVDSIDLDNGTVTVKVTNSDLNNVASAFTQNLLDSYSAIQLLTKLKDDVFLDESLSMLSGDISKVTENVEATVTLQVKQGKKNLVLSFDDASEDAVSGGALTAINSLI